MPGDYSVWDFFGKKAYKENYGSGNRVSKKTERYIYGLAQKILNKNKENLIFISHASDDMEKVSRFVDFLKKTGVPEKKIICSSDPDTQFPTGVDFTTYIQHVLDKKDTLCFIFLSKNFAEKPYCHEEVGAIVQSRVERYLIELPGFDKTSFDTLLNKNEISVNLGDAKNELKRKSLKRRLEEIQTKLSTRYDILPRENAAWSQAREEFLTEYSGLCYD